LNTAGERETADWDGRWRVARRDASNGVDGETDECHCQELSSADTSSFITRIFTTNLGNEESCLYTE